MRHKLSVMTKASASTDIGHARLPKVTFILLVLSTLAVGCSASRCYCHNRRACAQPTCCAAAAAPIAAVLDSGEDALTEVEVQRVPKNAVATPPTPAKTLPDTTKPTAGVSYDHDKEYGWLVGRLQRLHIPRDGWKVRYAPLDKQDRWGGSVVLAPDQRLENFKDGDTVYVEGEILLDRASLYLSGPRYRISTIRPASAHDSHRVARDNR